MSNYPNTQLLINNEWQDAEGGKAIDVLNPATGKVIGTVAHASKKDLDRALDAAQQGFEVWRKTPAIEREAIMRRASALFRERVEETARVLTLEQGKPLMEARGEALGACDVIEWFASESRRVYGRIIPSRRYGVQNLAVKEPVGPVAAFTPWNFPINQVVRKLSAALATGCSCIVKAPEETPASPAALIKAFVDAGVPAGVIGLVYGTPSEISEYLIPHPIIRKVTFTGSTPVGKQLAAIAGKHMKRSTMELGGHAPVIVAADADIGLAAKIAGGTKFLNAGQVCISPTRFLVDKKVAADFEAALAEVAKSIAVGDGLDKATRMGPLANDRRVAAMKHAVADAKAKGATVLAGGEAFGDAGNFFQPTILGNVSLDADVFNNEPFGPVAAIRAVDSLEEAIAEANRLSYGLAAYAFTKSAKNVQTLIDEVQTGQLFVNQPPMVPVEMPFGGVKDSGYGSEGGTEAMEAYLNTKAVSVLGV
jgi:succinate-semialdehyde dehydrogenase/glutarate-semialdehyde dehydrogenase